MCLRNTRGKKNGNIAFTSVFTPWGATYQWLHRVFEDDADAYEAQPSEESACAAFVVDHQGQVVPETAILSSALWGVGRLRDPGPHDPAWSEGFDDTAASFTARFDGIAEKLLREVYQNSFSARHVEPRLTMGHIAAVMSFRSRSCRS